MVWYAIQQQSYNRRSTAILSYHAAHNGAMCTPYDGLPSGSRSRNRTSRRQRMVTLAGQPQGWPVSLYAGTANPVNVTAPIEICSSRGDSLNLYKEAVYHG
ncbi:TPA: ash family protein [Salmonella enterica]|nr:ash family protein [Salmonella enterica]EKQ0890367.1 ash family protein [Salmonella enterica]HAG2477557.1 ash family protein [Salmonella enterica]